MTDTTRELIQRMATELDLYRQLVLDDCTSTHRFADEARALLSQPEPERPTDEELHHLWLELYAFHDGPTSGDVAEIARAALARWGSHVLQPIPVSERLPTDEDCDKEGTCWWWHPDHPESDYAEGWMQRPGQWGAVRYDSDGVSVYTHWLPAHVLPLPTND